VIDNTCGPVFLPQRAIAILARDYEPSLDDAREDKDTLRLVSQYFRASGALIKGGQRLCCVPGDLASTRRRRCLRTRENRDRCTIVTVDSAFKLI